MPRHEAPLITTGRQRAFSFSEWRPTDLAYAGESVLGEVLAAKVVAGPGKVRYLPLVLKQ